MTREVTVRIDSALMARDGSHMIVSAVLPDGRILVNVETPLFGSPQALAAYLAAQDAGYHAILGFTGNVKVEVSDDWPAKDAADEEATPAEDPSTPPTTPPASDDSNAGSQTPATDTPPTDTPTTGSDDNAPKAIGVKDGGKGKSKGE